MTINLADNNPRNEYTVADGNSQTVFTMTFEIFDNADLNVYVDNVLQTLTTHYKISDSNTDADAGHTSGTDGFVHFTSAVAASGADKKVVLTRSIDLERTTDFPASGAFQINSLNTELDKLIAIAADIDDSIDRSMRLSDSDTDRDMSLPLQAARAGRVLAFNSSTGVPEAGPQIGDVSTIAAITADISTLADIEDGTDATDAIQTVAGISSNVTTVAGVSSNVTTVAGISSNVTTVAGISSNVTTVAGIDSDVTTVAGISSNVTTVAGISANVTTVAGDTSNIGTIATDLSGSDNIGTVAGAIANVNTVGTNISDVNTAATNISSIQGASQAATDAASARDSAKAISAAMGAALDDFNDRYLGTMADSDTAPANVTPTITTTNGSADITVSSATGISIGMKVTSTNIPAGTNVIGISGTTISLDNSATAAASGTASTFSAHGVNGTFSSSIDGPSTDNDGDTLETGMLYFNTTDNEMRVYDGANWIAASAAGSASMIRYEYTVSGSAATTFSGADDNGLTLSYTTDNVIVVKDGVILHDDDYTSTNGTSIVLGSSAAVGSEIVIYAFKSFTVADTVSKASGGTFDSSVTVTGTLNATTDVQVNGASVATMGKSIAMAIVFGG
jgi:hypothetical protein